MVFPFYFCELNCTLSKSDILLTFNNKVYNDLLSELHQAIETKSQDYDKKVVEIKDDLERFRKVSGIEFKRVKGRIAFLEADYWLEKAIYSNAVRTYLVAGEYLLDAGGDGSMDVLLDKIEEFIQGINELDAWHRQLIASFLAKLPPEYQSTIEKINRVIKDK